jgi:outer membrane protein OmpA-like peptidoglycan-associated protein
MRQLVLTVVTLYFVLSVSAQSRNELSVENQYPGDKRAEAAYQRAVEKQLNPKTSALRTSWLANKPGSNWFLSLRAGMGGVWGESKPHFTSPWNWFRNKDGYWHPTAGLALGKWFSPVWGLRLDANYGGVESFSSGEMVSATHYIAGTSDFLVNLKNFFLPYNPKGLFNPVLYAGAGVLRTDKSSTEPAFFNFITKGGLQLNFRLSNAVDVFADGQLILVPGGFDRNPASTIANADVITNATIGLTYRFNFRHFIKAPVVDQNLLDALNKEINDLRNRPQVVCPPVPVCPEPAKKVETVAKQPQVELTPVFFKVSSYLIEENQLVSIERAAQYLLDNPKAKLEITAYSDKETGSVNFNLNLSEKRANAVLDLLVQKFSIDKSRLKVSFYGDTVQPFAENDKNRVVIFVR